MNESSGGTASSNVYRLSEEEEAALLAEYGTEGPSDLDVDWAAPSHFKSELGDRAFFLTGAADDGGRGGAGEEGKDADVSHEEVSQSTRRHLHGKSEHTDPLTLYLLQHVPALLLPTRATPASLAQPISSVVGRLEDAGEDGGGRNALPARGAQQEASQQFATVLRSGKEWERRASLAVHGVPTAAFASYLLSSGGNTEAANSSLSKNYSPSNTVTSENVTAELETDDVKLVDTTAQLLADADSLLELLAKPSSEGEAEAVTQRCIGELERREALAAEDVVDQHWGKEEVLHADEEDAATRELLQRSQETRQRVGISLALSMDTERQGMESQSTRTHTLVSPVPLTNGRKSASLVLPTSPVADDLYAFEMQLPRIEGAVLAECAEIGADASGCAPTDTPPSPLPTPEAAALEGHEASPPSRSGPIRAEQEVSSLVEDVSIAQLLLRSAALLDTMASAEQRDASAVHAFPNGQEHPLPSRRGMLQHKEGAYPLTRRTTHRDALGLVALPSFVERLDMLLSPSYDEQTERHRRSNSNGQTRTHDVKAPSGSANSLQTPYEDLASSRNPEEVLDKARASPVQATPAAPSLKAIRRQAAIESFLLMREAEEGRRMRREEEVVERERQAAQDLANLYADRLMALHEDTVANRARIVTEEAVALKELAMAQAKDAELARQVQQLRQLQQVEALSYTVRMEWEVHREQLLQEEALLFRRLTRDAVEAKALAIKQTEQRKNAVAAAARAILEAMRRAFEESRAALRATSTPAYAPEYFGGQERSLWDLSCLQSIGRERVHLMRWAVAQRRHVEQTRELLLEAEACYRRHMSAVLPATESAREAGRVIRVPAAPPTKEGEDSAVASTTGVLDAERLLHILWPAFRAAVLEPRQAAQYMAKWQLSLEDLGSVDWASLQSLSLTAEALTKKPTVVPASYLVKALDLSSNVLGGVDVLQAVRTFPLLQRITLSHAQLSSLDGDSFTAVSSEESRRGDSRPTSSRVSACCATAAGGRVPSSVSSTSHLRHISAARNHALAEHVHLLEIDVSSNKLVSLSPLGAMSTSSLTRCSAVDNSITSLEALSACTQLRAIGAAHNRITSMQCLQGLRLLRELDVGNNELYRSDEELEQAKGEAADKTISVLTKLFVSHNRLKRLPSSLLCVYPCLSQLFINHNELTALDAEDMAWFPLLRVLQAEGNRLDNISGLEHCPRLEFVKLSYNQLATREALLPLLSCRRLQALDLSGNPLFPDGGSNESAKAARFLRDALPWLNELNNTPLWSDRSGHPHSADVLPSPHDKVDWDGLGVEDSPLSSVDALTNLLSPLTFNTCMAYPADSYCDVFSALCWDAMLHYAQKEQGLQEALLSRQLNRAKGWEATITRECDAVAGKQVQLRGDGGEAAVAALYSITAAQRDTRRAEDENEASLYALDRNTLLTWLSVAERSPTDPLKSSPRTSAFFSNRHEVHGAYRQQEDDHLVKLARAFIAEWLFSRVLVRRAKRELQQRRCAYQASESFRREAAARLIQPVWRGAALRSRLRRLLHGSDSADEDGDFAKVNVNDWLTEDASAMAPVELLLHTVVDSARGVATVPFNVSSVIPLAAAEATAETRKTTTQPIALTPAPPSSGQRRANTGASVSGRPSSQVVTAPRAASAAAPTTEASEKRAETLEDQWGPAVAAQIRKKQQKNSRANQERMRKEFIQDPLRVQQEMRGAKAPSRPK